MCRIPVGRRANVRANQSTVPRRPRRQPAAAARAAGGARGARRRPARRRRASTQAEDEAIRDVVRMQEEAGLQSVTDGEFRRASWHMDFIYSLDGVSKAPGNLSVKFHNADGDIEFTPAALHIDGKLGVSRDDLRARRSTFLQSVASEGQTPKLTIPSPSMVHYRGGRAAVDESVYPDMDGFWDDLTSAYAEEVRRLGELGCTLSAVRRHEPRLPQRPAPARDDRLAGRRRRRRAPARGLHLAHQRGARAAARGHGGHDAHVPRQLPLLVGGRGRLRLRRRGAVRRARGRRVLHGVGRRALGRVRAAAVRAQGQAGRARARHDQARRARVQGRAQAQDRGGVAVRRRRPAVPVAAVRLLLDRGGQRALARAAGGEARD